MALAVAVAAALWHTRWRVVPTDEGTWRGLFDAPGAARMAAALLAGVVAAVLFSRAPRAARRPVLALGIAALPAIPVLTGRFLPLLALQGPVLVLVVAAVAAIVTRRLLARTRESARVPPALLFAAAFAFFALLATRMPGAAGPQGDEPQYVLLAHSLLTDGDVDLADEFAERDYGAFFAGTLEEHTSPFSPRPRAYSIHTPGLPLLILPGYALAGYTGVRLVLCALTALAALLVHRATRVVAGDDRLAFGVWALLVFAPPLPFYAMRVYPETPAALAAAVFLWAPATGGRLPMVAALTAAAILPWVHPKLFLLSLVGLAVALVRTRWPFRAAGAIVLALSVGLLLLHFHAQFGRATLHGGFPATNLDLGLLPRGVLAVLFDRQFGLLAVAPVLALAAVGAWSYARGRVFAAAPAVLIAGLFLALAGAFRYWWGGACPPARYVLPAVPALGILLAPALARWTALAAALGGIGLGIVGLAADAPRILHNRADGESLLLRFLSPSFDLNTLFPSFLDDPAEERPPIDRRVATLDTLWDWQPGRLTGPWGPPELAALALPFELPRAPWTLAAGERRNSRRMDVPPGRYAFRVTARPTAASARVRVALGSAPLTFAELVLDDARTAASMPILLPAGARRLGISAVGESGQAEIVQAALVPEALVPRDARGRHGWPEYADEERYRVGGAVRVTVLDRSAPEAGGFRAAGAAADALVDGAAESVAALQVRRETPSPTDSVEWAGRTIVLGPRPEVTLHLPLAQGRRLGPDAVATLRVNAASAWFRVADPPR